MGIVPCARLMACGHRSSRNVFNVFGWVQRDGEEWRHFMFISLWSITHVPGDQRNSGDCPELDLRGEQWRGPNSLLGSVKYSTGSTASKENGEECGKMHRMLPRVSGITNAREHSAGVRRSVRGNGGCFNLELWSLCVWRRWVRTSLRSDRVSKTVCGRESAPRVAVSRPGDWRYWERRCQELRTTWSATKWCCVRPVNSELRPVRAGVVCVC